MGYISTAIGTERLSRVSGYNIKKGFFSNETNNLPQIIGIFAEANTANQAFISEVKKEITSADEAGQIYGYGSPIHQIMRILRPKDSDGVGGIPTIVFPQLANGDSTSTKITIGITGVATKSTSHSLRIAGRENLDYESYTFAVNRGDTADKIKQRIIDVVNKNLSCPVIATLVGTDIVLESKWKGLTSSALNVSFNTNGNTVGLTYVQSARENGTGTPSIVNSLQQIQDTWITCLINSYGIPTLELLEQFNGTPSIDIANGRYQATVFQPFMAFFGSVLSSKDDLALITDAEARQNEVTNVLCAAPNSDAFPWEAAANVVRLFARRMQDCPESDINGMSYPDMPVPKDANIGDMAEYNNRDFLLKKGCSTVILNRGSYEVQDLVTTYHVQGETPLQFNYCRNLNLDWNVCDAYKLIEKIKLRDKVLIKDNQVTSSGNAIKPKEWKAVLFDLFEDLAERALINEPEFSKKSIQIEIPTSNPNRFNTFFRYKRTGIARIESTTAEAGF